MHTLLLSSVLTKEVYDKIIATTPYYNIPISSPYVRMDCIDNERLSLTEDEKSIMPEVYLFQFEQTIKTDKSLQGTGIITHFLEIRINYNQAMGSSGYYALPIEHTKVFVYETVIALVCKYIPILQPVPYEYSGFHICLDDVNLAKYSQDYLQNQQKQANSSAQSPLNLKLRRIDFAYDIFTDYKEILLDLMGKGYRPRYFKEKAKVYYGKNASNETITESNYLKSKSVYINTYNKENELLHHNASLSVLDKKKVPYILRFEVQVHKSKLQYMVKKEKKTNNTFQRNLLSFLSNELEYNTLKYYMESLIGTGHYFNFYTALDIIKASNYTNYLKRKLCDVIRYVSKYHSIYKFLERVEDGTITDMGTVDTAKNYLKLIHALGVNPVTISDSQKKSIARIKKEYPMPDLGSYKYGEDFIYNPLVNLELIYQAAEKTKYTL